MSLYNYIGTPNSNLICCICRAPFNNPLTTVTCQHTFCRECILRALSHVPQCPVDRLPLSEDELMPTNSIVRSMVDELIVECVYKQDGCSHQGERQQLPVHLRETCLFSEDGILRREKERRNNEGSQAPNEEVDGKKEENSLLSDSHSLPPASQSTSNDVKSIPTAREPRISHLTEQNILLRHRVESLESMVQVFKKEMNAVKTVLGPWMQNAMTAPPPSRHRSRSVNETLSSSSVEPLSLSTISESMSSAAFQPETPVMAPPSPPESAAGDERSSPFVSPQGPNVVTTADLASYFPADDEVRVQRLVPPQVQQRRSPPQSQRQRLGHSHHHSVPVMPTADPTPNYAAAFSYTTMGGYSSFNSLSPPFPPYATAGHSSSSLSPVSDLTISSPSILHTFQGLQSDLTTVSSNLDELNRKTDLALSLIGGGGVAMLNGGVVGEVLRLGEEVMGVRANVQGLRMQVHGMLMGSGSFANPGLPRQPNPQSSPNTNYGTSEEEASLAGRVQIPFPGGFGSMSPPMGLNPRFGSFPGAFGITKL